MAPEKHTKVYIYTSIRLSLMSSLICEGTFIVEIVRNMISV